MCLSVLYAMTRERLWICLSLYLVVMCAECHPYDLNAMFWFWGRTGECRFGPCHNQCGQCHPRLRFFTSDQSSSRSEAIFEENSSRLTSCYGLPNGVHILLLLTMGRTRKYRAHQSCKSCTRLFSHMLSQLPVETTMIANYHRRAIHTHVFFCRTLMRHKLCHHCGCLIVCVDLESHFESNSLTWVVPAKN